MQGALVALHYTLQNLRNPTNSASLPKKFMNMGGWGQGWGQLNVQFCPHPYP